MTIGKITSNGIEAIKSIQLLFCFKNKLLGFEMMNVANHWIKSIMQTIKSKILMLNAMPAGNGKKISTVIAIMSITINTFSKIQSTKRLLNSFPNIFKITP